MTLIAINVWEPMGAFVEYGTQQAQAVAGAMSRYFMIEPIIQSEFVHTTIPRMPCIHAQASLIESGADLYHCNT